MEWGDVVHDIGLKKLKFPKSHLGFYSVGDKIRVKNHGILETTNIFDTNGYVVEMRFSDETYLILRTGDSRLSYWYSNKMQKWVPVNQETENSFTNMTVDEVHLFARNVCNGAFAFHADVFLDHEIDGFELLRLDNQSLQELGITDRVMQRKFLSQVQMKLDSESIGLSTCAHEKSQAPVADAKSFQEAKLTSMSMFERGILSVVERDIFGNGVNKEFISKQAKGKGDVDATLSKLLKSNLLREEAGVYVPTFAHISVSESEASQSDPDWTSNDLMDMLRSKMQMEQQEYKLRISKMNESNTELRNELAHVVRNFREAKEELRHSNRRNRTLVAEIERLQDHQRKHKGEVQKLEFELLLKQRDFQAAKIRLDQELQLSKGENLSRVSEATLQELLSQTRQSVSRISAELEKRRNCPPSEFFCPITHQIMEDPVMAVDGFTYERSAILKWFTEHVKSPLTNLPLEDLSLRPNQALFSLISEYKRKNLRKDSCI